MFHEVKKSCETELNFHHLRGFFVNQGIVPFDHEIIEILRRLDKDDDGTVSFRELEEFLRLIDSSYSKTVVTRESVIDRDVERETVVTRSINAGEYETVTKTVTKDDLIRDSPTRVSETRTSVRKSYGHRPSGLHHHSHRFTHTHRPLRHYHDVCYSSCAGSCRCHNTCYTLCMPSCHSPCNLHCCADNCRPGATCTREVVVEREIPRRSLSRSYRSIRKSIGKEIREPTTYTRVTRRSVSPGREPVTYTTEIRKSVSPPKDEPITRTVRSVRRSYGRTLPQETTYTTEIRRSVSRDRDEPITRTVRSVRRSYGGAPEETVITEVSNRDRDEPITRTVRSVRRSYGRAPEETVITEVRRSVSRDREPITYTTSYSRTAEGGRFSRPRNANSRSRKNLEDLEYSSYTKGDGIRSSSKSRRESVREITTVSSRRSIHRTGKISFTKPPLI